MLPVTKEEALRYKKEDLEREIEKLKQSIKIFENEIEKSNVQINRMQQMITIIDISK